MNSMIVIITESISISLDFIYFIYLFYFFQGSKKSGKAVFHSDPLLIIHISKITPLAPNNNFQNKNVFKS